MEVQCYMTTPGQLEAKIPTPEGIAGFTKVNLGKV